MAQLLHWLQTKDPVEYVSVLLAMRDKHEATISRAFADDKSFRNTLNQVRQLQRRACLVVARNKAAKQRRLVRKGAIDSARQAALLYTSSSHACYIPFYMSSATRLSSFDTLLLHLPCMHLFHGAAAPARSRLRRSSTSSSAAPSSSACSLMTGCARGSRAPARERWRRHWTRSWRFSGEARGLLQAHKT
jgi:hypothetical protein